MDVIGRPSYLPWPDVVRDFGAVADGVTDNTAAILAAATALGSGILEIPYNCKFNRASVIAGLPAAIMLQDFSVINDYASPGETCKHVGIVSKDSAPNDTHWAIDSGHHPILNTNNFGSAGTSSATERKASWIWCSGFFALGTVPQQGFRGVGILQWTKDSGGNYWSYELRSLAPWVSAAGSYELWAQGQVIGSVGVYRANGSNHYVSASTGTTGGIPPVHTSGTVSDGGVDWTWIDSTDRTVWKFDQYGRVGTADAAGTFRHKVGLTDPTGDYVMELAARGTSRHARLLLIPTNGGGSEVTQPYLRADTSGLRIMRSDSAAEIYSVTDSGGCLFRELRRQDFAAADGDTTPSVEGRSLLEIGNTGATNITALDDGQDNQEVRLLFLNGNTTLVHSATLMLTGSVNVTPTAYSVIDFQKVRNGISNRWVEASRSIK